MLPWSFRTFWPKMAVFVGQLVSWSLTSLFSTNMAISEMMVFVGKIGEEVVRCRPPMNSFLLFGVVTSVLLLAKIDQEMRP